MRALGETRDYSPVMTRPHVILLGAGASRAGFPNGDRNGKLMPVLADLVQTVGVEDLLRESGFDPTEDFERLYGELKESPGHAAAALQIESRVREYFESLRLPDQPTLYDHLVLSLRPKDVVASFNWDPLLVEACIRTQALAPPPRVLFLHGNTGVAVCHTCELVRPRRWNCARCGGQPEPIPLLYPVHKKDYSSDPFIAREWEAVRGALQEAYILTIFGSSAPTTDVEAVSLLKEGWGPAAQRNLEEVEIIDIKPEHELLKTWRGFIHTEHYRVTDSFYSSWTAQFPRRSCEAMWGQLMERHWTRGRKFPSEADWDGLRAWVSQLLTEERVRTECE
jgi:hypothetical protein